MTYLDIRFWNIHLTFDMSNSQGNEEIVRDIESSSILDLPTILS